MSTRLIAEGTWPEDARPAMWGVVGRIRQREGETQTKAGLCLHGTGNSCKGRALSAF